MLKNNASSRRTFPLMIIGAALLGFALLWAVYSLAAHVEYPLILEMTAKGNVADTGVVEQARQAMTQTGETDICKVLQDMYQATPPGKYRNKIRATMKYFNCARSRGSR